MSCNSCGDNNGCGCSPCTPAQVTTESVASSINNLVTNLFGTFTKTIVNGRAVWTSVCSASASIAGHPRNDGEGFICYILRIMATLGVFVGGAYSGAVDYAANTFVTYGGSSYVSLVAVAAGTTIPGTNSAIWLPAALGTVGPAGPQGIPGAAGPGATANFAHRTTAANVVLTNTDDVVFCTGMLGNITITIPDMSGLSDGKGYQIQTDATSGYTVTIVSAGADTFDGAASIVLAFTGESAILRSDFAGLWKTV